MLLMSTEAFVDPKPEPHYHILEASRMKEKPDPSWNMPVTLGIPPSTKKKAYHFLGNTGFF